MDALALSAPRRLTIPIDNRWGGGEMQVIRGVSHLKFDAAGKVNYHRDYWDAVEELYMKLPVLGMLMRGLRWALAAPVAGVSP